ncbi:MAG TPA: DUF5655 domain-containing protein [Candidatus Limnocylindrales bacterium]|nr:DUF5655 domain-containing protein [Candidatus Limnocylindrales bacterium]
MKLFSKQGHQLTIIQEKEFDLEKDIQTITERNLNLIFGYQFVCTEFPLEAFYLDTLAFDEENKSFVIIEYKKKQNLSIMDQGTAYLNLVLDHKADVIMAYNEVKNKNYKKNDIRWDQTRILFIAPDFSPHQKRAITEKSPYQLWQVSMYGNNLISYNQILHLSSQSQSIQILEGRAASEIKVFSRDDIVSRMSQAQKEILSAIEETLFQLGSGIQENSHKEGISFNSPKTFIQVWRRKQKEDSLTVNFPQGNKLQTRFKELQGQGEGRYIHIHSVDELLEIKDYIKQAYKNSIKEN